MTQHEQHAWQHYDHVRRCVRFFAITLASPFLIGLVSAWTATLGFLLFLIGSPVLIGVLLVGSILYSVAGVKASRQTVTARGRFINALAAPIMLVITLALAWPSLSAGGFVGTWARLMMNKRHYEAIIAKAEKRHRSSGTTSSLEEDGGTEYIVDTGPPVRVAFNPQGMLDNWSGIIFDPTGEVMLAKGFDPITGRFAAPERVTKLFDGDLVRCRKLWANFYDCSFT